MPSTLTGRRPDPHTGAALAGDEGLGDPAGTPRGARLNAWLNDPADPWWERPGPTPAQLRNDVAGALAFLVVALAMVAVAKSMGMRYESEETWRAYVATAAMILPLAARRRYPLAVLLASSGLFVGLSYLSPEAAFQIAFQVAYFTALYTAVAWARDRRPLWIAMGLVLLAMTLWVVAYFTVTAGFEEAAANYGEPDGPLPQLTAAVLYSAVVNLAYFGGAILVGRSSWRGALQRERLAAQAAQIREQAAELARRAVVDERLRIARELHDVVAHHVSVIGIQAAAARRVLPRDPGETAQALRTIESSSRDAVAEMRSLLGVLRSETGAGREDGRAPEPGLRELAELADTHRAAGLAVTLTVVEEREGDLLGLSGPLALCVYRVAQEALANVRRHSTAARVSVTVRTGTTTAATRWVEVEVVDDGAPRSGTAGSGYGLRGLRERVQLHSGEAEIGPREGARGWRVRARLPLRSAS